MFKKPFKIKAHTQVKGSERKSLRNTLMQMLPQLTEDDMVYIWQKKETVVVTHIITANGVPVSVYSVEKRALFLNINGVFFPTVYLLWRLPKLAISFMTNDFVISKIEQGADLMLPGVINNPAKTDHFYQNTIAYVHSTMNKAAIAVGVTAASSDEMRNLEVGKCIIVYHYYGDKICTMDDMSILPLPQVKTDMAKFAIDNIADFPALSSANNDNDDVGEACAFPAPVEHVAEIESLAPIEINETEQMDNLLKQCFLTAIKYSKSLELPILTSSFYKVEMLPNCPEGKILDIKKSSYKKLGQFLKHMEKEGLVVIKEKKKGVETIETINKEHQQFLDFYVEIENRPKKPGADVPAETRNIVESYAVTQPVANIFKEFGYKYDKCRTCKRLSKGTMITGQEVRKIVTDYVKKHNLQDESNKRFVMCTNPTINTLCKNERSVTWEELFEQVLCKMTSCFKISDGQEQTVNKGKLQPITMTTQTRSGNKKVTIVDNLELYHIKLSEFAKECQHGVAASTSISRPSGKKTDQILIQGNQVLFVYNLLIDKYKIPKKYIKGLENAPKKK